MNATLVCAALVVALSSCRAHSPVQEQLVGTWQSSERQEDGSTTPLESTFMADGTYTWGFPSKPRVITGRWHIDGPDLVIAVETQASDSGLPTLPPQIRSRVVRVTAHELVVGDAAHERQWTR
jgi:hypothetical protein